MAALEFLKINIFAKSNPALPAEGDRADEQNVLIIEKRKLADALGVTKAVTNLNAIIKGLGGGAAATLVTDRKNAILTRFGTVFEQYKDMKKTLVQNGSTIAEAHEAAFKLAEAAMEAHMVQINRLFPERTEEISAARELAKRKADIY
jgi:transketolase C-terminal domain/subunit